MQNLFFPHSDPCAHAQGHVARRVSGGTGVIAKVVCALLLSSSFASAQTTVSGTVGVAGGAALVDGDQPAFQQRMRERKDGYAGLEDLSVTRTTNDTLFRFEARFMEGIDDYRLAARFERFDAFYVQADFRSFRTFYDGSGGRFLPRNLAFSWFDENLALDRSYFTLELGTLVPNRPQWRLRYERSTRSGMKNSIRWGESNLAGQPFVPRAFIPSYYLIDEARDAVSLEVGERTEKAAWEVGGRYERTQQGNKHVARRRMREPQDRYVTTQDNLSTDLFSGHGFYERIFHEKLRMSAGGLFTTIDSDVSGSKIYGVRPDAEFSPTVTGRQPGDVGYRGLLGNARMKQYLGNLNVVYEPAKFWLIRPGVKYEHLRQDSGEGHTDTDFGGGAAAAAIQRQIESDSRNSWNEISEEIEVRYKRWADWVLDARAQFNQGTGNLVEQSILLPNNARILDRETEYERLGQRYIANATWYLRPGLTLGAQYNYRVKIADYDHRRDNTNNRTGIDRYPAFIVDQDIESHDANIRVSWRPKSMLSFVTRYAHQQSIVTSTMGGQPEIRNGRLVRHIITQTASWHPTARLYFTGAMNATWDQLVVPAHRLTYNSDNNYINATLGAGYALGKVTDLYVEANHYRADNYTDNPTVTLPLNAGQMTQSAFLTWVRRQSDRLIYTAKYGYVRNRDGMFGGQNDFDAHLFYGKVQYKF